MIAELKKQTDSVLAQVRDATGNFREIDRLDAVAALPGLVSANVISLAGRAHELSVKLGYETTLYECLAEMETVDALIVVDEVTHDLVAKDTPAARQKSSDFLKRSSEPSGDTQKPLWRYLTSAFSLCDRLKNEAKPHLQQARSLESAGKKSEALREYQEINRIYPNRVTADKIRQLESQPH